MRTQTTALIAAALFAVSCAASRHAPFLTPHDGSTVQAAQSQPRDWLGGLVAFEGTVTDVRDDRGRPLLQLTVSSPGSLISSELWVANLVVGPAVGTEGDRVRVLGYFVDDDSTDLAYLGIPPAEPRILCLASVNLSTGQTQHVNSARNQWKQWQEGAWPTSFPNAPAPIAPLEPTGPFAPRGSAATR